MMFIYYGYLLPLSTRIRRGLYQDGIWTDSGFMRYTEIGGLTWKGDDTLVLASRQQDAGAAPARARAFTSAKCGTSCGRRSAITRSSSTPGPGLHLGTRDTRESV